MTRSLHHLAAIIFIALMGLTACGSIPEAEEPTSPTGVDGSDSTATRSDTTMADSTGTDTSAASSDSTGATTPDSTDQASSDTSRATPPSDTTDTNMVPVYGYRVVNTYPHDPNAYTQGLVFIDSTLYEGTGLYGQSSLRRVRLETGEVLQSRPLASRYFGEGIAAVGDSVFQLTWRSQAGFIYRRGDFEPIGQFTYPTEGWGLTWDGTRLIQSDGTSTLYFRDPRTFAEVGRVTVVDLAGPVQRLNELECIEGEIYANVWTTDWIARIDPSTGRIVGWIDLTGLLDPSERRDSDAVLNGIAYDAPNKRLFVTGKWWPKLFEIEIKDQ